METPFVLVDAFTDAPYRGNTAAVVTTADGLTTDQMQRIARELGQTETCFVAQTPGLGLDWALRWFTPTVEVALCGHATVAAFVALAAAGRLRWVGDTVHLRCGTRSAPIDVWVERTSGVSPVVTLSVGVAALELASDEAPEVARAVGIGAEAIDPTLPMAIDRGSDRLIIPVARLDDLLGFVPNGAGMFAYGERSGHGYRRFTLVCRQTADPARFVHIRHFAPANGIPEDPVTGTAHAVAAVYLDQHGMLPGGDRVVVSGEQGHALGRQGRVTVDVRRQAGRIRDVRIGGSGAIVARGTIDRPAR